VLREVGFFDVFPWDDAPAFNGSWSVYPYFASGSVILNGIEQGLFVVKPRRMPQGEPQGLAVTIAGPGLVAQTNREWSFVAAASNHGPGYLSELRVIEMPSATTPIVSVVPSQGTCSTETVVTCDLGALAPGSSAFITMAVRANGEGDLVTTALATARSADGSRHETSALTVTRGVSYGSALALRRPVFDTTFWVGRNNTIQWTLRGVSGGVSIDLSRDDGETWTRLADAAENVGFYDWTGTGDPTDRAKVRVTSVTKPELTQTSPRFAIGLRTR